MMEPKIIKARMQQRTDTLAHWESENPVLLPGELGLVSDDPNLYKVGDGEKAWNDLPKRGWDGTLAQTTGNSSNAAISQKAVTVALGGKVDTVPGKDLSTNDYTDAEKAKLSQLENYDDADLRAQLQTLDKNKADKAETQAALDSKASLTAVTELMSTINQLNEQQNNRISEGLQNVNNAIEQQDKKIQDTTAALQEEVAAKFAAQNEEIATEFAKQNKEIATEFAKQNKEIEGKVSADGKYPELTAGFASNLVGRGEAVEAEINFRPSGGGSINDGTARIAELKGNSVVWNQMLKNDIDTLVLNGVTFTNNGDGSFSVNGTASADTWYPCISSYFAASKNHKYLLYGCPKGGTYGTYCLFEGNGYLSNDIGNGSITQVNTDSLRPYIVIGSGFTANNLTFRPRVVDLTKMFGAGNEPSTVEEFYARIPSGIDINAYNEGEVVNMNVEGIKSVGFNQWKAESTLGSATFGQNYVVWVENNNDALESLKSVYRLLADGHDVYYSAKVDGTAIGAPIGSMTLFSNGAILGELIYPNAVNNASLFANIDKKTIEDAQSVILYATNSSAWSVSDICINLVHTGYRNGDYEPYKEFTREIDPRIREAFADGMKSAGTASDKVYNRNGKGVIEKRIGVVNLGSLVWSYNSTSGQEIFFAFGVSDLAPIKNDGTKANLLCAKYDTKPFSEIFAHITDKTIGMHSSGQVVIYDSAYTDAASFKAAMQGVMLYYELAEPIVTEYDEPFNLDYLVWDFGTEESIAEGASAPLRADIIYQFNAVDNIRNNKLTLDDVLRRLQQLESMVSTMQAASVRVE